MAIEIKNVALVGLGTLGAQIALQAAAKGYRVTGFDPVENALDIFMERMSQTIGKDQMIGPIDPGVWPVAAGGIEVVDSPAQAVAQADLVIEVVPEKLDLKRKVWAEMDAEAPLHALLATNSSSMPVSMLEGVTRRPEKCLNLHFYQMIIGRNMADVMGGSQTLPEVLEAGFRFIASLGLMPLKVKKESFGFCFNRVWRAVKRESLHMWAEGIVDFRDVDRAWMIFNSTPRGPFALMDAIGLDVIYDIETIYQQQSGRPEGPAPRGAQGDGDVRFLRNKNRPGVLYLPGPGILPAGGFLDPEESLYATDDDPATPA